VPQIPPAQRLTHVELMARRRAAALRSQLSIQLVPGKHWTTDAIHRTTFAKAQRYREQGVNSIDRSHIVWPMV
jgi:hypothetical protein